HREAEKGLQCDGLTSSRSTPTPPPPSTRSTPPSRATPSTPSLPSWRSSRCCCRRDDQRWILASPLRWRLAYSGDLPRSRRLPVHSRPGVWDVLGNYSP